MGGITGVGEGNEVRPPLAAEFKGRPMGSKFNTLQKTFGFQSITNLKLLFQIQQFLVKPLGGIGFWTRSRNNYINTNCEVASNKLPPNWTLLHRDSLQVVNQTQNGVITFIAGTGLLLCTTNRALVRALVTYTLARA
jgi:hypothetical protein